MADARALPTCAEAWRRQGVLLCVAVLALGGAYWHTFADMVRVWSHSSTFNHCFLIPLIAGYLVWGKREELAVTFPSASYAGVAVVAANGALWLLGELATVAVFKHLAVVGLFIGLCWTSLGGRVFRVLLFPLLYLYFAVPEGEFLVPYLQDWTALVTVKLLQVTGIPVYIEGRYLTIPSGRFVVAEACSGINYLIATLAVGTMFMYLQFRAWWRRLLFLLLAIVVPLLANGMRAYGIVMIAHLSDYKYALGIDHFIYGGVFFALVIFLLFYVGAHFSDVPLTVPAPPVPGLPATATRAPLPALLLALAIAFAPRTALEALDRARQPAAAIAAAAVTGWSPAEPAEAGLDLGANFVGVDQHLSVRYAGPAEMVVDWFYYRGPALGAVASQSNVLFDKERWQQLAYARRTLAETGAPAAVNELVLRDDAGNSWLLWSWYDCQGERLANRLAVKFAGARARLSGRNEGEALVVLRTPLGDGGTDEASARLLSFLRAGGARLNRLADGS